MMHVGDIIRTVGEIYLYELDNWSASWQMKFNIQKCKVLHLGKKTKELLSDVR